VGQETVPAGEDQAIESIRASIAKGVEAQAAKDGVAHRDAHAKHHGCVRATFTVDEQIPASFKTGVFAHPGKAYPAWIRYSNGSGTIEKDSKGDGRGMAVKLMDVPGQKILEDEATAQTQDFLMINHPVFFTRNALDYVHLVDSVTQNGSPFSFFFPSILPWQWHGHEALIGAALTLKKVDDPLAIRYFSMTPYRMGNGAVAVKYSAKPCKGTPAQGKYAFPTGDFYRLREAMTAHLKSEAACFEFMVQPQKDAKEMPIEDPTIEWSESDSPFVTVAKIEIPKQAFDTPAQQEFCENLSMTPWHSLPEHRPLGGINRVRKVVYQSISELRHHLNGVDRKEPTPTDNP
jgi:catalase